MITTTAPTGVGESAAGTLGKGAIASMKCLLPLLAALVIAVVPSAAPAAPVPLHFTTFAATDLPLGDVVWTGSAFLYNAETLGKLETSDASGDNFKPFLSFDQGGEEMRCVPAPNAPSYWPAGIYCHTPDNRILRLATDGSSMTELAKLPSGDKSDGAIAFDTVGKFGYALLAATGGSTSTGGEVFSIRKSGTVKAVGSYSGPGGAENIVIAPARFGTASGAVLLSVDQDLGVGRLLAMDARGNVKVLADRLPYGINPIEVLRASPANRAAGLPAAGLYLADTNSKTVYFTAAPGLKSYVGDVIVVTEKPRDDSARVWIVQPKGSGFQIVGLTTDLPTQSWNFESAAYMP